MVIILMLSGMYNLYVWLNINFLVVYENSLNFIYSGLFEKGYSCR